MKQPQGQRRGWLKNGNPPCDIRSQPRCQATAKSTKQRCGNIAVKGKRVCRIHGGKSTGVPNNGNALKHGLYTAAAKREQEQIKIQIRDFNEFLEKIQF